MYLLYFVTKVLKKGLKTLTLNFYHFFLTRKLSFSHSVEYHTQVLSQLFVEYKFVIIIFMIIEAEVYVCVCVLV